MKLLTDALLTSYIVHEKRAHFAVVFYFWSMIQTFPLLNEMFWFFLFLETATFFLLHVFLWLRCFFSLNFLLIWWKSKFSVATPYKLHHGLLVSGNNQENQTSFRMCYMEWNKATLIGMSGNGQFGIIFDLENVVGLWGWMADMLKNRIGLFIVGECTEIIFSWLNVRVVLK